MQHVSKKRPRLPQGNRTCHLLRVVTYFLDLVAGPDGFAFGGGDLVGLLDGGRLVVLVVVAIIVAGVRNIIIVS